MLHVQLGYPLAEEELDPELAVLLARAQSKTISWHRAKQEALREVRPLVGESGLGAYKLDFALKARVAQAGCDGVPRGTAADDQRFRVNSRTRSRDHAR